MAKQDKPLNSMGLPVRIQSVREAIKYFDENPVLTNSTPIADAKAPRGEGAQFRHPQPSELMSGDFRKAPMHFRGTLTDTTRFTKEPQVPADRLNAITPHDKLSDNIALRLKRDLQRDLMMTEQDAAAFVGNFDHESGGFGRVFGNLWQNGRVNGNAYGYPQWDDRREAFFNWAKERGLPPESYEANYGFIKHELLNGERGVREPLSTAKDIDDATYVVAEKYERPNPAKMKLGERQALARRALQLPDYSVETPVPPANPMRNPISDPPWRR
ncbi:MULTISPECIES: phage tail tip lysozyme [unclassified Ensifer]|uniref:phage tail tip lysozyme n=1 Tax=unclassified Ensifer TaxID=2633371 RepID=UPI000A3FAC79|nr:MULTISPECIES: phage tail tip lysozyme [unclassified Ensifer]